MRHVSSIHFLVFGQIPSAYGPERLDLLRKLEKVKELETSEESPEEIVEELVR